MAGKRKKKTESRPSFSGTPLIRKRAEPEFLKLTVAVINVAKDRLGFYFIFLVSLFLLSLDKKKKEPAKGSASHFTRADPPPPPKRIGRLGVVF